MTIRLRMFSVHLLIPAHIEALLAALLLDHHDFTSITLFLVLICSFVLNVIAQASQDPAQDDYTWFVMFSTITLFCTYP